MGPLDDKKWQVVRNLDSSFKKVNESFSTFWNNTQNLKLNGEKTLLSTPVVKGLDSTAKTIGQSVHNLRAGTRRAISSSVSGLVKDIHTLKKNVERNVQALTSGGAGGMMTNSESMPIGSTSAAPLPTGSSSAAPLPVISFPPSRRDMLEGAVVSRVDNKQTGFPQSLQRPPSSSSPRPTDSAPSTSFAPSEEVGEFDHQSLQQARPSSSPPPTDSIPSTTSSLSEEVSEEDPHPDFDSVSATSVFSIGYVGPPLLGPQESEGFVFSNEEAPTVRVDTAQETTGPEPVLRLEDVRRSIGKALIVYKRIRALGFPKSSWENKMPWRNPRPARLAKGLKWPQQKFSSVRERHEYHRRARRRGRYLIGPTPGWSWFAADIVFLYFLINNPAGNFLI